MIVRRTALTLITAMLLITGGCGIGKSPEQHVARAKELYDKGDLNAGIIELKNALQSNPKYAEARWLLGKMYLQTGDGASANKELERAKELGYKSQELEIALLRSQLLLKDYDSVLLNTPEPGEKNATADLLALRGDAWLGKRKLDKANAAFDSALKLDPDSMLGLLGSVRAALAGRNFDLAQQRLNHAEGVDRTNVDLWILRGAMELMRKQPAQAEQAYRQALELREDSPISSLGLARALLEQRKLDEAGKQISKFTKQFPGSPDGNFLLGVMELQRNNTDKAKDAFLNVVKAVPSHVQAIMALASIYYKEGQLQQAENYASLFQTMIPDYIPMQKLAAAIEIRLGNPSKAVSMLEHVLDKAGEDSQFLALLGSASLAAGDPEKGVSYLNQAAALAPDNPAIKTELALGKLGTGSMDEAIKELKSAVELDPNLIKADILLTSFYLQKHEFEKALETVQKGIKRHPDNPEYYNLAGAAYLGQKKYDEATEQFNKAIAKDPKFTPAMTNLANLDFNQGRKEAAKKRFEDILRINDSNIQALVGLARIAQESKDINGAVNYLERARSGNQRALVPRLMLIAYYLQTGSDDKALEIAQEARDIAPNRLDVLALLGESQSATGRTKDAMETFEKIAAARPDSPQALLRLGVAQSQNGNFDEAKRSLQRSIELKPDNLVARSTLTSLEMQTGNIDKARKLAADIVKDFPKSPEGLALQGDILMSEKKFKEAVKDYQRAFSIQETGKLAVKLHQSRLLAGDRKAAYDGLIAWIDKNPGDLPAKALLAQSYSRDGKKAQAIHLYEECLKINPDYVFVLNNLAWLYYETGDARALELAQRAYKLSPKSASIADTLAWILIEQKNVERGLALLRPLIGKDITNPTLNYHYAVGLSQSGEPAGARTELERILATKFSFPEREKAQQLLKSLNK